MPNLPDIPFELWFKSYLLTLILEVPIFMLFGWRKVPLWRAALAGVVGSTLTHPVLWYLWPLVSRDYAVYIISGELFVATVESITFFAIARPTRFSWAVSASFIANASSYGIGVLLRMLGLFP